MPGEKPIVYELSPEELARALREGRARGLPEGWTVALDVSGLCSVAAAVVVVVDDDDAFPQSFCFRRANRFVHLLRV